MRGELFTKDSVSSYHPSYEADLYDLRPQLKRIDGVENPRLQARVRQDTKESLKQEALDRLRHISEYRILQTGFVRVGKYLCLGALLPPYFILVRLPFLLLRAGNQIFQQITMKIRSACKNGVGQSKNMLESIQFMQRISHLLQTVIKVPSSVWEYMKEQSRAWLKDFFSQFRGPKISIPSLSTSWKMDLRSINKNRLLSKLRVMMKTTHFWPRMGFREKWNFWFQSMQGFLRTRSLQIAVSWREHCSFVPKGVQAGWNHAFVQAQAYLQYIFLLGEKMMQKMWNKQSLFSKKQDFFRDSETDALSKVVVAAQVSWRKIQNWGCFVLDGWRILFLACIALVYFVIKWGIWGVLVLWGQLPFTRIKTNFFLKVPQLQWSGWTFSWCKRSFLRWKSRNFYTFSCDGYIYRSFSWFSFGNKMHKIFTTHCGEYVKLGFRLMLLSFLMSCIATVWAIQAIDRTCSKKVLRNLGLPFFNKS